jgi:hypothetical protein
MHVAIASVPEDHSICKSMFVEHRSKIADCTSKVLAGKGNIFVDEGTAWSARSTDAWHCAFA